MVFYVHRRQVQCTVFIIEQPSSRHVDVQRRPQPTQSCNGAANVLSCN